MPDLDEVVARLDDPAVLESADRSGVLRALAGSGARVRRTVRAVADSLEAADDSRLRNALDGRPRAVAVLVDDPESLLAHLLRAPAVSAHGAPGPAVPLVTAEQAPAWLAPLDLCLVVDASGERGRAAVQLEAAARCGARTVLVAPVDSRLAAVAATHRAAVLPLPPADGPLWTAGAGPLAAVLLALDSVAAGAGMGTSASALMVAADRLDEAAERCRVGSEAFVNPAKSLAASLATALPALWGEDLVGRAAAGHAATLLRRVAGLPAVHLEDRVDARLFDGPHAPGEQDLFRDRVDEETVATLRLLVLAGGAGSPGLDEPAGLATLAEGRGIPVDRVTAGPDGPPLASLAELAAITEFTVAYAALGVGLDPGLRPDSLLPGR